MQYLATKMYPLLPWRFLLYLPVAFALVSIANGAILYSGDNSANQLAPDLSRQDIFNSIGRIAGGNHGSVVHVRGKYLLTANHVNVNTNSVTFDGSTIYSRDTSFSPIQIGPSDMKLIKLVEDPGLAETTLFDSLTGDTLVSATMIAWGVGRDPNVPDSGSGQTNIWEWGGGSTMAKRWGTNTIDLASTGPVAGYTYDYLQTDLDRNAGDDEVGATIFDSGSGLFVQHDGQWKLAGITAAISAVNGPTESNPDIPYSCTFDRGNPLSPNDKNYFVRISSYVDLIEAAIPDTNTYSGWKIDHGLYGGDAQDVADTDGDGVGQLLEFALGGDPNVNDRSILPSSSLTSDGAEKYLELTLTRPASIVGIDYTPKTTSDLNSWPIDSTGIEDPAPTAVDNGNGTETLVYRRAQAVSGTDAAFIRLEVSEN